MRALQISIYRSKRQVLLEPKPVKVGKSSRPGNKQRSCEDHLAEKTYVAEAQMIG